MTDIIIFENCAILHEKPWIIFLCYVLIYHAILPRKISNLSSDLQVCMKLFDCVKDCKDHNCTGIEDTGSEFICHLHDPPKSFKRFKEIDDHLKSHTNARDAVTATSLKISCPVCYKVSKRIL